MIEISHPTGVIESTISPPTSKSESNRALIIYALNGKKIKLNQLSNARDTIILKQLLLSKKQDLNVQDAGTTMRFLTSYFSIKNQKKKLYGTNQMHKRPIKLLVNALNELGTDIKYLNNIGFPPIEIKEFIYSGKRSLEISGNISSQYISSLLLISPYLPEGLEINIEGKISSQPYIILTIEIMRYFGIQVEWKKNVIKVHPGKYQTKNYTIKGDWSSAGYWYSISALATKSDILVENLFFDSYQADEIIASLGEKFGIKSNVYKKDKSIIGIHIQKKKNKKIKKLSFDFTDCPDLAPTIIVLCAALSISFRATGLANLQIKESNRIKALQQELKKVGVRLKKSGNYWITEGKINLSKKITVNTYDDHRIAMAFAPLALMAPIRIKNPSVVKKSYPDFWKDLKKAGFKIKHVR